MKRQNKAIVFVVDSTYIKFSLPAIRDVFAMTGSQLPVYVLHPGPLNEAAKKDINNLRSFQGVPIEVVEFKEEDHFYAWLSGSHHVSKTAYAKLLIADLLPEHVEYAYYFDVDILVMGDLLPLLEVEPKGGIAAVDHRSNAEYVRLKGTDGRYLNSGVLVINMARWRELEVSRRADEIIKSGDYSILWHDQDLLTIIFDAEWEELPIEYNFLLSGTFNPYIENCGDLDWDVNKVAPKIVHFLGPSKPWGNLRDKHSHALWWDRFRQI